MRKKLNWIRHFGVLLLTIMIFTIGIFIGGSVEQMRVQNLYVQLQEQDLDYQNLVTEERYITYLTSKKEQGENISCDIIKETYYSSIENLDSSRIKLENYINSGSVKEEEFARLKEHYFNIQISYWILANKINKLCDNSLNPILYFYADKKVCPACDDQGVHLDYVKKKLQDDVLVFSLDGQKQGAVKLIASQYEINHREYPSIIINDEVYGFLTNKEVFEILCENSTNIDICK
ncbi:MAG: hypothetical protein ACOCP8_09825 [archaeon]